MRTFKVWLENKVFFYYCRSYCKSIHYLILVKFILQIQFFTFLDMHKLAPMVPWLEYINNILTTDLDQVTENERVIVDEPGKRWRLNFWDFNFFRA